MPPIGGFRKAIFKMAQTLAWAGFGGLANRRRACTRGDVVINYALMEKDL